jgi:prepilin-type N-terminal cleavage/methylation domain-containing protein
MNAIPTISVCNASRRRARRGGFTLVEVLATLLLLAIALPAIGRGFALSSRAAELARTRTDAGGLAESKLNELVATGVWQSGGNMTGGFDDHPEFQWSATLAPWGVGQGAQGTNTVQQMDVVVTWKVPGGTDSVTVSTLVYLSPNATGGTGLPGGFP